VDDESIMKIMKDPATRNILVHPDRPGVTWIDFERAEFLRPRVALGNLCPNRKRKLGRAQKGGTAHCGKNYKASINNRAKASSRSDP
jgi:hypothetical protein